MTRRILWVLFVLITALMPVWAYGQGVQTGAVTGTVTSSDKAVLSDANVVVSLPALQRAHTTTTDLNAAERSALVPLGGRASHYPAPRAGTDGGRMTDVAVGFRF